MLDMKGLFIRKVMGRFNSTIITKCSKTVGLGAFTVGVFVALNSYLSDCATRGVNTKGGRQVPLKFHAKLGLSRLATLPFIVLCFIFDHRVVKLFLNTRDTRTVDTKVTFLGVMSP